MGRQPRRQSDDDRNLSDAALQAEERADFERKRTVRGTKPDGHDESRSHGVRDIVDEASADSFPASDPPNWATGQQREPEGA